jgi:hypothetical protein
LNVENILWDQIAMVREDGKIAVGVSGPRSMSDEVRRVVCIIGKARKKSVITLVDETFGW